MSAIYLFRHAQAGPRHAYDTLSELGRAQARSPPAAASMLLAATHPERRIAPKTRRVRQCPAGTPWRTRPQAVTLDQQLHQQPRMTGRLAAPPEPRP